MTEEQFTPGENTQAPAEPIPQPDFAQKILDSIPAPQPVSAYGQPITQPQNSR